MNTAAPIPPESSNPESAQPEAAAPSFFQTLCQALRGVCPRCKQGKIFETWRDLSPRETCPVCALPLGKHDNGDGPAVFLIFILGVAIVPLALIADRLFTIPLWVHGVLWTGLALILCVAMLRPLKSYIITLQYRHLPRTFEGSDDPS